MRERFHVLLSHQWIQLQGLADRVLGGSDCGFNEGMLVSHESIHPRLYRRRGERSSDRHHDIRLNRRFRFNYDVVGTHQIHNPDATVVRGEGGEQRDNTLGVPIETTRIQT